MKELKKTLYFGGAAVLLALIAFISSPKRVTPEAFLDTGELFFPDFQDPNDATTLEVVEYNEETGTPVPFKVTFKDGQWTIPSHYDYPADAKDRLSKTAAGVIGIRKDEFRSDNVADHEALGVIDPLDETVTTLKGRGTRITLKNASGNILADFIMSKNIEDKKKLRYVRVPGQKRVYASKVDIDLSTKFADWINNDLLEVTKAAINKVIFKDYSINERSGTIRNRDVVRLTRDGSNWKAKKMSKTQEVDKTKMNNFLTAIDELSIVGVRPKPQGLTKSLTKSFQGTKIKTEGMLSLQSKGYYFTRDGQLLSNEGEIQAQTNNGVTYTLRFGEIVYGSGLAVTAGTGNNEKTDKGAAENRYLFITTQFDGSQFKEPPLPKNTAFKTKADSLWSDSDKQNKKIQDTHDQWQKKIEKGQKLSDDLNERFAKWYYVISNDSFEKLHLKRKDLIKKKEKTS